MDLIKKYKVVFAVVIPILILVLVRSLGSNHFKTDAKKWGEPSLMRSNIITGEQAITLSGEKLIINLGKNVLGIREIQGEEINIPADSLLCKKNLNVIRNHDGPVLLYSSETAISARIWMILSQMGYRNIYILTNDSDNEVLKNKFRPDTIIRPEL